MSFLKRRWVWGLGFLILILIGFVLRGDESVEDRYEFATIERANLDRFVDVVGAVRPIEYVDLAFEQAGRVAQVFVRAGDRVYDGQLLATLSSADARADVASAHARVEMEEARLLQAQASVDAAEIKLEELMNGSRAEEIDIKRAAWNTAIVDFSKAITDTALVRDDAYHDVQYSVEVTLASLFLGQQNMSFDVAYDTCDVQRASDVAWRRYLIGEEIALFVSGDIYTDADAVAELTRILALVVEAEDFVKDISTTLTNDCTRSNITLDGYRADVDIARARLKNARSAIISHRQTLSVKRNARDVADADLRLAQQGPRPEVIAAQEVVVDEVKASYAQQEASVRQAQAFLAQAQARSAKTVIRSPLNGIVVKHDVRAGSFVTSQQSVMRIEADDAYEIEVFIPELDISEVAIGADARITLDAYGDDKMFNGYVYVVEAAETLIEGVPTYKAIVYFDMTDDQIASGMTANVEIVVAQRADVIAVPVRAIQKKDEASFVRLLRGDEVVEVDVVVGLKSSDGRMEIQESDEIRVGDRVILFEK